MGFLSLPLSIIEHILQSVSLLSTSLRRTSYYLKGITPTNVGKLPFLSILDFASRAYCLNVEFAINITSSEIINMFIFYYFVQKSENEINQFIDKYFDIRRVI